MARRKPEPESPHLSPRERAYVNQVMNPRLNDGEAAERIGLDRAAVNRLKTRPRVAVAIRERQEEARERSDIRQDEVVGELMTVAFGSARELVEWADGRRHVDSLSDTSMALVKDVTVQRKPDGSVTRRVALHPKVDALDKLARHLSLYGPDGEERRRKDMRITILAGLPEEVLNKLLNVATQIVDQPRQDFVDTTAYLQGPDLMSGPETQPEENE